MEKVIMEEASEVSDEVYMQLKGYTSPKVMGISKMETKGANKMDEQWWPRESEPGSPRWYPK